MESVIELEVLGRAASHGPSDSAVRADVSRLLARLPERCRFNADRNGARFAVEIEDAW